MRALGWITVIAIAAMVVAAGVTKPAATVPAGAPLHLVREAQPGDDRGPNATNRHDAAATASPTGRARRRQRRDAAATATTPRRRPAPRPSPATTTAGAAATATTPGDGQPNRRARRRQRRERQRRLAPRRRRQQPRRRPPARPAGEPHPDSHHPCRRQGRARLEWQRPAPRCRYLLGPARGEPHAHRHAGRRQGRPWQGRPRLIAMRQAHRGRGGIEGAGPRGPAPCAALVLKVRPGPRP